MFLCFAATTTMLLLRNCCSHFDLMWRANFVETLSGFRTVATLLRHIMEEDHNTSFGSFEKINEWNTLRIKLLCLVKTKFPGRYTVNELNYDFAYAYVFLFYNMCNARFRYWNLIAVLIFLFSRRNFGKEIPYGDFNFNSLRECLKNFVDTIRVSDDDDLIEIVSVDERYINERFEYSDAKLLTNCDSRFEGIALKPKLNFRPNLSNNLFSTINKPAQFADDFKKINPNKTDKFSVLEVSTSHICSFQMVFWIFYFFLVKKLVCNA